MTKTLFLFGAGASAFCGDCAYVREKGKIQRPPLGNKLFDALLARGLVPKNMPKDILKLFKTDFEAAMHKLSLLSSDFYNPLQRNLAKYLARFYPLENNLYVRILKRYKVDFSSVVFSTLNYDNLLELSASLHLKTMHTYGLTQPYPIKILKLHGGCGILPETNGIIQNVIFRGNGQDVDSEVSNFFHTLDIEQWLAKPDNNSLSPAMAMYMEGKPTKYGKRAVDFAQDQWKDILSTVEECYIIGVRLEEKDAHIWEPLLKSKCHIKVVTPTAEGYQKYVEWAKTNQRENVSHFAKNFEDAVILLENTRRPPPFA